MIDQIIAFVFSVQLLAWILVLIGLYALLWWSIENFKSIVQIIRSVLVPYFQPQEDIKLSEKFGSWAGIGRYLCTQSIHLHNSQNACNPIFSFP